MLYKHRLLLTKQTCFKAVKAPLGAKRTISIRLGVGRYITTLPSYVIEFCEDYWLDIMYEEQNILLKDKL